MREALFDAAGFSLEVRLKMARENLSLRELQFLIEVDHSSIHRVAKRGLEPCIETYLRLRLWLDGDVGAVAQSITLGETP